MEFNWKGNGRMGRIFRKAAVLKGSYVESIEWRVRNGISTVE